MTNEEIIARIRRGDDLEGFLFTQNRALIADIIQPYLVQGIEEDDLMQEAFLGLHEAAQRYDEDRGVRFMSYAAPWIKHFCRAFLNKTKAVRIPSYRLEQIGQYKRLMNELETTGEKLTKKQICERLKIKPDDLREIRRLMEIEPVSLSIPIGEDGGGAIELGDIVKDADFSSSVDDIYYQEQLREEMDRALNELEEDHARAIRLKYYSELTESRIGEVMGVSRNVAARYVSKGMRKLRSPKISKRLREFIDISYSMAWYGGLSNFKRTNTSSTEKAALRLFEGMKK